MLYCVTLSIQLLVFLRLGTITSHFTPRKVYSLRVHAYTICIFKCSMSQGRRQLQLLVLCTELIVLGACSGIAYMTCCTCTYTHVGRPVTIHRFKCQWDLSLWPFFLIKIILKILLQEVTIRHGFTSLFTRQYFSIWKLVTHSKINCIAIMLC